MDSPSHSAASHRIFLASLLWCVSLVFGVSVAGQNALQWGAGEEARVASLPVVTVATDATWPPMEYINITGELVGFDIDLLREVGRRAGFRPDFVSVPWDGIFLGLSDGRYDMIASSVTVLEERRRVMDFSRPYMVAAQYVVVHRDSPFGTLEELRGEDVGAQIGTTGARIAGDAGARVRTYDDLGLAVEDLIRRRLAAIVADVAIVEYFILQNREHGALLSVSPEPYAVEEYAFAFRRDRRDLREAVDAALEQIISDGTMAHLKEFWFPHVVPPTPGVAETPQR